MIAGKLSDLVDSIEKSMVPAWLRDYVEDIRSRLLLVPDVSKIELLGAQDERIFVEFSMKELASLGIDRSALISALQAQNVIRPSGTIQTGL